MATGTGFRSSFQSLPHCMILDVSSFLSSFNFYV
uniref:Uncharacterized protein n=1 Tax=Nelumbo nucifera TaxID=4432 RepID=A0A822Z1D3_NELNU|nr:TPA_asm: hypothetical protein HUJ06_008964 [Nelumbo nucifera]